MTATTGSIFSVLPSEVTLPIFERVLATDGNLHSRVISTELLIFADEVIKKKWLELVKNPPSGPFNFKCMIESLQNRINTPKEINYLHLFRELNRTCAKTGISIPSGELKISKRHFARLQKRCLRKCLDFSLDSLCNKISKQLILFWPAFGTLKMAREWLYDPFTANIRSTFHTLDLSDVGIRFIPIEILCFPNLRYLNLSDNHIEFIPRFLGELRQLVVLNLRDNDIQSLPKEAANWTHITRIDLADNPLNRDAIDLLRQREENRENRMDIDVPGVEE